MRVTSRRPGLPGWRSGQWLSGVGRAGPTETVDESFRCSITFGYKSHQEDQLNATLQPHTTNLTEVTLINSLSQSQESE